MAKKGKKGKNIFSFKDIFKATIYFKISDTIIAFFTLIIILLAVFGYYLVQKSIKLEKQLDTNNNTNNTNSNNTNNSNNNNSNNSNNNNIEKKILEIVLNILGCNKS